MTAYPPTNMYSAPASRRQRMRSAQSSGKRALLTRFAPPATCAGCAWVCAFQGKESQPGRSRLDAAAPYARVVLQTPLVPTKQCLRAARQSRCRRAPGPSPFEHLVADSHSDPTTSRSRRKSARKTGRRFIGPIWLDARRAGLGRRSHRARSGTTAELKHQQFASLVRFTVDLYDHFVTAVPL